MKKKMAANAEKEKNATEPTPSKPEKPTEKPADKPADKSTDKPADKSADKSKDKPADKKAEKAPEKAVEKKPAEKKDGQSEKKKEENGKGESSGKTEKATNGRKQNGNSNGVNGDRPSSDSDSLVVDEADETELFPELAYDDSDGEWEQGQDVTRSLTRRDQVKATRTPETPRPASGKQEPEESKDSKVLKIQDAAKADTTKSDKKSDAKEKKSDAKDKKSEAKSDAKDKKSETKSDKKSESAKQDGPQETVKADAKKEVKESPKKSDKSEKSEKVEIEVVVDIENSSDPAEESRKPDTNFSKSRVKVSPYRRSMRLADQTTSSIAANYTGNNTTMEMDITESSSFMEESMDDSYLSGLRSIKGRRSYKPLKEMALRNTSANRSVRSVTSTVSTVVTEQSTRPTAPVVGRKRKPEPEDNISIASEAEEVPVAGKRQRLLDRLARPFRRTLLPVRRNAEIVGINTDLPLTAPVASTSDFDPESLKPAAHELLPAPAAAPAPLAPVAEDSKRCVIM